MPWLYVRCMQEVHPFYADLINVLYSRDHYKLALGQLNTARNLIDGISKGKVKVCSNRWIVARHDHVRLHSNDQVWRFPLSMQTAQTCCFGTNVHAHEEDEGLPRISWTGQPCSDFSWTQGLACVVRFASIFLGFQTSTRLHAHFSLLGELVTMDELKDQAFASAIPTLERAHSSIRYPEQMWRYRVRSASHAGTLLTRLCTTNAQASWFYVH